MVNHINDANILYVKTSKLVAKPVDEKMMINIDGEYGGDAPMKFKNLKRHIEIFANTQEIPERAITEVKEDEDMDEAKKNFVDGVQELDESDNIKLDK